MPSEQTPRQRLLETLRRNAEEWESLPEWLRRSMANNVFTRPPTSEDTRANE